MINGKILVVMAHPDDESFGPGGTIAKYAACGVEIHLLCATRGDWGMWSGLEANGRKLADVRENEHREGLKILGVKELEYLGYVDGHLSNILIDEILEKVRRKVEKFKPEILLTFDLMGLSGHIDHMTMTQVAIKVFEEEKSIKKLYFYTYSPKRNKYYWEKYHRRSWGRPQREITTFIDCGDFLTKKVAAAKCHLSQMDDVTRLMPVWDKFERTEYFVRWDSRVKTKLPETDLFAGINE